MISKEHIEHLKLEHKQNWKDFLRAIEKFIVFSSHSSKMSDIYGEGLTVFSKLPGTILNGIYTLSDEDFIFELKRSFPKSSDDTINELYDNLLDYGHIGTAVSTGNTITIERYNLKGDEVSILIIPLTKRLGVNGLVLSVHRSEMSGFNQFLLQLCTLFANLLGRSIENNHILMELEFAKSTLEQKIATRTLDLAQSRRELKAILDSILTGVLICDISHKKIFRVNPVACSVIGLEDSKIVGKSVFDFLEFIDYNSLKEDSTDLSFKPYESYLKTADGKKVPILRNTSKLRLNNRILINESFLDITVTKEAEIALTKTNELLELKVQERTEDLQLFVHKLKNEISERENAEYELRKLFEKQKELGDMKTRFVSMVSHEFKTPLTNIKSSAQMITKFKDKISIDEEKSYLDKIISSVDSLTDLIENVVFIGKNETENLNTSLSEFDFKTLISEVINNFESEYQLHQNLELNYNLQYNTLESDENLIKIILNNLISNAVKYSSPEQKVIVTIDNFDNYLSISVKDNGIGIPEIEQEKIFDIFYRASNVSNVCGTGIGLAVVKEAVVKLGGRIELKSKIDIGSEFIVYLPI